MELPSTTVGASQDAQSPPSLQQAAVLHSGWQMRSESLARSQLERHAAPSGVFIQAESASGEAARREPADTTSDNVDASAPNE